MFQRSKPYAKALWLWFRSLPVFLQLLLVFPIGCAILVTLVVGNMGLALMGTAIAIHPLLVGWIGGLTILILPKAGIIVAKDKLRKL